MTNEAQRSQLHWMLLRLAGRLPDELTATGREWLAGGRHVDIGRAVTHAVLSHRLTLTETDLTLLNDLLVEAGGDASALSMVEVDDFDQMPMYGFAPGRVVLDRMMAAAAEPAGIGAGGYETAEPTPADQAAAANPEDDIDLSAIAAAGDGQALALWRSWRFPVDGAPWPPPRRVYVVEVGEGAEPARVAIGVQRALIRSGEAQPQVEVYPVRAELPSYQRMARAYGALLWAHAPDPGVRIATLFDGVDEEDGPLMNADHPTADPDELEALLDYLRRGEPLLVTTARMDDVVDPSLRATVPMNFLTDGHWIWTDASTYYLEQHLLLPDPQLVDHVRARDFRFPDVDGSAIHRALAVLQEPSSEEPAWTYG